MPLSRYTAVIAEHILAELMAGRSLGAICREPGMPTEGTVQQWARDDREGFAARFRHCRKVAGPKGGGPTVYTPEIAERILGELMEGRTLADVCRDPGMPRPSTVRNWATADRDGFAARYLRARELGYGEMRDELLEILDDGRGDWIERVGPDGRMTCVLNLENIRRARLRATARIWLLSKTLPRNYRDRPNLMQRLKAREAAEKIRREIEQRRLADERCRILAEQPTQVRDQANPLTPRRSPLASRGREGTARRQAPIVARHIRRGAGVENGGVASIDGAPGR